MMARSAKKLVTASEQLEELTPAELTEVSGGYGYGSYGYGGYGYAMPYGHSYGYGGYGHSYGHSYGYGYGGYQRPSYHRSYCY